MRAGGSGAGENHGSYARCDTLCPLLLWSFVFSLGKFRSDIYLQCFVCLFNILPCNHLFLLLSSAPDPVHLPLISFIPISQGWQAMDGAAWSAGSPKTTHPPPKQLQPCLKKMLNGPCWFAPCTALHCFIPCTINDHHYFWTFLMYIARTWHACRCQNPQFHLEFLNIFTKENVFLKIVIRRLEMPDKKGGDIGIPVS